MRRGGKELTKEPQRMRKVIGRRMIKIQYNTVRGPAQDANRC